MRTHGLASPVVLTEDEFRDLDRLIARARARSDGLEALPVDDIERRRSVWSELVEVQGQITALLHPVYDAEPRATSSEK